MTHKFQSPTKNTVWSMERIFGASSHCELLPQHSAHKVSVRKRHPKTMQLKPNIMILPLLRLLQGL